jgi:hypothetical protein
MAERNIIGSLFGVTPEMYQQQRQTQQQTDALRFAQLTPEQQVQFGAFRGGQQLGNVAGGLLGVEDPELNLIRQTNQLVQQIGIDTPEKLKMLAGEVQKLPGGAPLAAQAVQQANKMLESQATVAAKTREKVPTIDEQAATVRYNELVQQFGEVEGARKYREEQLAGKQSVAKAGATPGSRTILSVEAKKAEDLQKQIGSGYTVLERLNEQRTAIEQGMIGGSFADTRTAIGTFASTIGLADPGLINALANSKSFKANQNALAAAIAKQLGVNPTDKDFQASLDQFAKTSDDPKASLVFIKQMQDKFGKRQKINEDMFNSYIDNEGTFRNYKGPRMVEPFTANSELERLLAEKNKRTNKQK